MNRESARSTQGTRKRKGKEVAMWHLEVGAGVGGEGRGPLVTEDSQPGQTTERFAPRGQRSQGQALGRPHLTYMPLVDPFHR